MDQEKELVLNNWGIKETGDKVVVHPIVKGISSNACLVEVSNCRYVLRQIDSVQQAQNEWIISRVFAGQNIVPLILPTHSGLPCAYQGERCYNLQKFMENTPFNSCNEEQFLSIATQVGHLHQGLKNIRLQNGEHDRFCLHTLLQRSQENHELLHHCLQSCSIDAMAFNDMVRNSLVLDSICEQPIHGDLGIWNMLWTTNGVQIIDFGECRYGSVYLDVAAALTSAAAIMTQPQSPQVLLDMFRKSYAEQNCPLEEARLLEFIGLWFVRGIFAVLSNKKMSQSNRESAVLNFLRKLKYYGVL
jgi:Ser/Thr protein kinase RdoA (MazF antagonist)